MKLALIPPVSLLEHTARTDFQLMLPHLVHNRQYAYTYMQHCRDMNQYVILDNGVAEGKAVDPAELFDIADKFRVSELVLPDVMGNAAKTRAQSETFLEAARDYYKGRMLTKPKFQYVLQGTSIGEYRKEARWAASRKDIDVIALNRWMIMGLRLDTTEPWKEVRNSFAGWMLKVGITKAVHLLGGSPDMPNEIRSFYWTRNVRSHDTSAPFNFAHEGLTLGHMNKARRPLKYFDLPVHDFDHDLVTENVDTLMKWCGYDV